jgi:rubrerythrin
VPGVEPTPVTDPTPATEGTAPTPEAIGRLERARAAERLQTRFYRALAAEAVSSGDLSGEERLNELHADEQHHLARITARLLELGLAPEPLAEPRPGGSLPWPDWEDEARSREEEEIRFYTELMEAGGLDPVTREIIEEILASERQHARVLGGKWVPASPGGGVE